MIPETSDVRTYQTIKIGTRTFTGFVATLFRLGIVVGSLFFVLLFLIGGLFLTKYINENYQNFQANLQGDPVTRQALIDAINTFLSLFNLLQKVLQIAIEIWNYCVPSLNLLGYIFYRIIVAVLLTIFGVGSDTPPNDNGDSALPLGATPDPTLVITGGMSSFLNSLECILIDLLTIAAGIFRVLARAIGACLVAVFEWLDESLKMQWYRKEYCKKGSAPVGAGTTIDPDTGRTIYDDGSGPGNICPDNSPIIQGLIRFIELVVNILRDVFILVFPIVADLLKMIFDALMKILPQLMEGLVKIIEIFAPDQPLGKILMFLINFMIQVLGFFIRSCVLQLIISVVMCLFNVVAALVVNIVRGIIEVIINIVCVGGLVCDPKLPGDYLAFPKCDWSSFTNCVQENYDNQQRNVTTFCQIPTCSHHIKTSYSVMHHKMKLSANLYSTTEDYQVDYYKNCLEVYQKDHKGEDTVEGHLFCRFLTEEVHNPAPLGIDPTTIKDPFEDSTDFCGDVSQSCLCRYNSPICQSQTCCLNYYSVLVQQIFSDMNVDDCSNWEDKIRFAQLYCVARTQRSLQLAPSDLLGTASHCDGFVGLYNQTCYGKPKGSRLDLLGIVGGLCSWVDKAGFCDAYRRPAFAPTGLDKIADAYNQQLRNIDSIKKDVVRGFKRSAVNGERSRAEYDPMNPSHHTHFFTRMKYMMEDHYHVAYHSMSEAFPLLKDMVITPAGSLHLGEGVNPVQLNPDIHLEDGRLRTVRRVNNNEWKDYNGDDLVTFSMEGKPMNLGAVPPTPYTPQTTCLQVNSGGYPGPTSFQCQKDRMGQTGAATGGSIDELTGPGKAQDKIDDMVTTSSTQVYAKTTNRPSFGGPANQFVNIMYDYDMQVPSGWTSADTLRINQNPNWKQPLATKNSTTNRPGSFTIYGRKQPNLPPTPLEECPVPINFPWEKVFKRRETFLTPLEKFVNQIPEWTDKNIPELPQFDIPKHVRDANKLMYERKNGHLRLYTTKLFRSFNTTATQFSNLMGSWQKLKDRKTETVTIPTENKMSYRWEGIPQDQVPPFMNNILWGVTGNSSTLCINQLLSPYECCTDEASAYECCFGLFGCLPPPPLINVTFIDNLDFIVNATCSGGSNIVLSIFAIPRFIFGSWVWALIFIGPTWLRPLLFKIFWPIIYDYGGKGIFDNLSSQIFCAVVNAYYFLIIVLCVIGLFALDYVYGPILRELYNLFDLARIDTEVSSLSEQTLIDRKTMQKQIAELQKRVTEMKQKSE